MNTRILAALSLPVLLAGPVQADGTESLGEPSIPIAAGTAVLMKGVGLIDVQPGTITIDVPANLTVLQGLLYWEGFDHSQTGQGDTDVITIDAGGGPVAIEGQRIGGPTRFYGGAWASTYRFDISAYVHAGLNSIEVSGLDFSNVNNGAGLAIIVDDGLNTASLELRDGSDLAFINFVDPLDRTAAQEYGFEAADFDRPANLQLFAASVALEDPDGNEGRPTIIDIKIFSGANLVAHHELVDRLDNGDGDEWDTYETEGDANFDLVIPSGADRLIVELKSEDAMNGNPYEGHLPASMDWISSFLNVPGIPREDAACRMTGGAWIMDGEHVAHGSGQAGAPTAQQPQPRGEWTHHQRVGPEGIFVFHAGTSSAPEGTEIDYISCSDPGWCNPARPAPAKQIDFRGVGSFRSLRNPNPAFAAHVTPRESLHFFSVHVEDLGEPGGGNGSDGEPNCPEGGNAGQVAECGCPDFYSIKIHETEDPNSPVLYEVFEYVRSGNYQIHPEVGSH